MRLYFRRSSGEEIFLGNFGSIKSAQKMITKFINEHHYKSYYTRIWWETDNPYEGKLESPHFTFDVGSWSEFFYLYLTPEEIDNLPDNYKNLIPQEEEND